MVGEQRIRLGLRPFGEVFLDNGVYIGRCRGKERTLVEFAFPQADHVRAQGFELGWCQGG